jgi:GNAT superfamily N-acetyltransferase
MSTTESTSALRITVASSDDHLRQILDLQARNHADVLAPEAQAGSGFVYARHTLPLLRGMADALPQAVALAGDAVVGYCLAMPRAFREAIPALAPMFDQFERCHYRGRPLGDWTFFVGGQVCVATAWRGQGLIGRLYGHLAHVTQGFDLCVTEIATRNTVSLSAHRRIGFEDIAEYHDGREAWVVVAKPLAAGGI